MGRDELAMVTGSRLGNFAQSGFAGIPELAYETSSRASDGPVSILFDRARCVASRTQAKVCIEGLSGINGYEI